MLNLIAASRNLPPTSGKSNSEVTMSHVTTYHQSPRIILLSDYMHMHFINSWKKMDPNLNKHAEKIIYV